MADLADRPDRVLQRHVAQHDAAVLEHPQHARRGADLEERRVLAHVGVADDDVEAAVALGVGVRLVAGVDDRAAAGGRRADALPDVLGPLGDGVRGAAGGVQDLAGAGVDLAADEERDQHLGVVAEVVVAAGAVVLVAAVAVAGRVGVVLEEVDGAADRLLGEALLGRLDEALEDPLPCLVVDDELVEGIALRRGVLGVGADVEVEAGAVLEEDVGAAAPADHATEEVAGDLVGAEPALAPQRARDAVLVLEAVDPPLHEREATAGRRWACGSTTPRLCTGSRWAARRRTNAVRRGPSQTRCRVCALGAGGRAPTHKRGQEGVRATPGLAFAHRPPTHRGPAHKRDRQPFSASSFWWRSTISSTAFMLRSASCSRPARARALESSVGAAWPWNSGNTRWAISS